MNDRFLTGLAEGKTEIVKEIYSRYLESVVRWTLSNNGSRSDALDIFQEGITQILIAARKNKINLKTNFGAYLISTCKYTWLNRMKKEKRLDVVRIEDNETLSNKEDFQSINHESDFWLNTFLERNKQKLSETCIRLLTLISKNINSKDIAQQLNMTNANTVYRRKFACLKTWREHIEEDPLYHQWKDAKHGY